MNTITQNALDQLNKDKQAKVVDLAQSKITYILKEKEQIASYRESIKVHQEAVSKMAEDMLTDQDVFGRPASTTPSQNEATILQAIKQRNDDKQKSIEANSKCHLQQIDASLAAIKGCEDRIIGLRKELDELAVATVTEAQINS
jgi:archaellin